MKKLFMLPYSEIMTDSDFNTAYVKGASIIYKKNYYPFTMVDRIYFTFAHGICHFDIDVLKNKRRELREKEKQNIIADRKVKANSLIFEIEQAINDLSSNSKTKVNPTDILLRCKNYISFYSE